MITVLPLDSPSVTDVRKELHANMSQSTRFAWLS
ncbi:NADH dehydrogenase (ubiquinone) 1, subcomplex unknown, 1, isoform CRA_a [Mus musculus]|nr:NADH dehydrogenase (ubiquinone) 1, subcomplex unknown, 1, isoform CRA_a [Mus musculus]